MVLQHLSYNYRNETCVLAAKRLVSSGGSTKKKMDWLKRVCQPVRNPPSTFKIATHKLPFV